MRTDVPDGKNEIAVRNRTAVASVEGASVTTRTATWLPQLPDGSTRLRLLTGYFHFVGILGALGVVASLILALAGRSPMSAAIANHPWSFGLVAATVGAFLWTGRALSLKKKSGGEWALAAFAMPIASRLLGQAPAHGADLVQAAIGVLLVISIWGELE